MVNPIFLIITIAFLAVYNFTEAKMDCSALDPHAHVSNTIQEDVKVKAGIIGRLLVEGSLRIPRESCHPFHTKVATDSTQNLPLIP